MDWYDRKTRKMVFRAVWLVLLLAGIYLLYSYYKTWNLSDYQMQNSYTGLKPAEPAKPSENRSFTIRQSDSVQQVPEPDSQIFAYTPVKALSKSTHSSLPANTTSPGKGRKDSTNGSDVKSANALQGPSAIFAHDYTVGIGKTIPVTIAWSNAGSEPAHFRLVSIKVNDIADGKVRFTIEDPFNVLLFSQTGYGVNDKIVIRDTKHDINISVLQVNANSVVVKLVSHLDEGIVSKLQKAE